MSPTRVKTLTDKQERRRQRAAKKPGKADCSDEQQPVGGEADSEVYSDCSESVDDGMEEVAGQESAQEAGTASGSSTVSSTGRHMSVEEIENLIATSQTRIGTYLLEQSELRMEARAQQMLEAYDRRMTQKLVAAQREVEQVLEEKLEARVAKSEQAMAAVLQEAREAAQAATTAMATLSSAASSAASSQGGSAAAGRMGQPVADFWAPKTVEVKGICAYKDRYTEGVSSEFAVAFIDKLQARLSSIGDMIDWQRSKSANRYTFNIKIVLVLQDDGEQPGQSSRQRLDKIRELKDELMGVLQDKAFYANRKQLFAAVQAPPWRRELYALAAKFTSVLMDSAGGHVAESRREYNVAGLTILYRRKPAADKKDKNASVMGAAASTTSTGWRRLASWSTRLQEWDMSADELRHLGITEEEVRRQVASL